MRPYAFWRVAICLLSVSTSSAQVAERAKIERLSEAREAREARKRFERLTPGARTELRRTFGLEPTPNLFETHSLKSFEPSLANEPGLDQPLNRPLQFNLFREALQPGHLESLYEERQQLQTAEIRTAQALLKYLGYYAGPIDGVASSRASEAARAFETKTGRPASGKLDRSTLDQLFLEAMDHYDSLDAATRPAVDAHTRELLASVGFGGGTEQMGTTLRRYQRFQGLPETGQIGPGMAARLKSDLGLRGDAALASFAPFLGETPEMFLRHSNPDFFGFLTDGGQSYFLARPNSPELWVLDSSGMVSSRLKGSAAIERFHQAGRAIAAANSNEDLLFLHASPLSSGPDSPVVIQIGSRAVTVSRAEFLGFLRSANGLHQVEEVLGGGRRAIVVLATGTFASTLPADFKPLSSATAEAAALKARYGNTVDVFFANDARTARENAGKVRRLAVKGREDITVYTAKTVTDYGIIENLKNRLTRAGIRVVGEESGYPAAPGTNTIVVSGHRDRPLIDHLNRLKDSGALKGKLVAVVSCYEPGAESLQSALMSGPGAAAGVLFYDVTISAVAVESVLQELATVVGSQGFAPSRLDRLLDRSVDRALKRADTLAEKTEIEKLRRGLIQLSLKSSGVLSETVG